MRRPFKFESVLNHRQHLEDDARRVLAEAVRQWKQAQSRLAASKDRRALYRKSMRQKQNNKGTAQEILLYSRYLVRLDFEIKLLQTELDELHRAKEDKRQALLIALKDRKVIEKLKDRFLIQQEQAIQKQEQKLLGEVAVSRYQRRQGSD